MRSKPFIAILCAALLLGAMPSGAFAAEIEDAFVIEEASVIEDAGAVVIEDTAAGGDAVFDVSPSGLTEAAEETPPAEPYDERPAGDPADVDPEVPAVDGASATKTWDDYTPRALKSGETLKRGIDVSNWQGAINWTSVAASGVDFVFIRAAYRSTGTGTLNTDSRFRSYISGAKAAGLKVGVYIFSQAITTAEAVEEAEYLLELVKGYRIDLPLVFDLEHYTGGRFTNAKLSKRAVTDMCLAFCAAVERAGYESMVYANPSNLANDLYPNELGRLWLANYTAKTSYTARSYEYWQCSDSGIVDGISGAVDLNFWFMPTGTAATTGPQGETVDDAVFTDVRPGDWYYDAVMTAYYAQIVNGMTADAFCPNDTATRGQVVTMLYRMEGSPAWSEAAGFTDLTQSYYRDAINWASEKGVVSGYSKTSFKPEQDITREELVSILYRMAGSPETDGDLSAFTDAAKVQSYARAAMAWAVENGVITGYGGGILRPGGSATRAEVCAILMRFAAL